MLGREKSERIILPSSCHPPPPKSRRSKAKGGREDKGLFFGTVGFASLASVACTACPGCGVPDAHGFLCVAGCWRAVGAEPNVRYHDLYISDTSTQKGILKPA